MPSRKNTSDTPVATITPDGTAVVGGRPATPDFTQQALRQANGMPPLGSWNDDPGHGRAAEAAGPVLPNSSVAWAVVSREVRRLKGKADGIERDLSRGVLGVTGQVVPHLAAAHQAASAELASLRDEIARLEEMTDEQARQFAGGQAVSYTPSGHQVY